MKARLFSLAIAFAVLLVGPAFGQTTTTTTTDTSTTTTTNSTTGVLIYELSFKHVAGFNVDFYDGGFVVVPATGGGKGSVIFTATDRGRKVFHAFDSSVAYFPAKSESNRYFVITMNGSSSATVSMQAFGKSEKNVKIDNPTFSMAVKVAGTMRGMAQAALDESSKATTSDDTNGFVEYSEMKLHLDEGESNKANKKGKSVSTAFTDVKNMLTSRGYVDASPTTTTTGGSSSSGSTTTTGSSGLGTTTNTGGNTVTQ